MGVTFMLALTVALTDGSMGGLFIGSYATMETCLKYKPLAIEYGMDSLIKDGKQVQTIEAHCIQHGQSI